MSVSAASFLQGHSITMFRVTSISSGSQIRFCPPPSFPAYLTLQHLPSLPLYGHYCVCRYLQDKLYFSWSCLMNFTEVLASVIPVPYSTVVWTVSVPAFSPLPFGCISMLITGSSAEALSVIQIFEEPRCCTPLSLEVLQTTSLKVWSVSKRFSESLHSVCFLNYQKVLYMCCQELQNSHLACNSLCCGSIIHLDQSPKYLWLNFFTWWPTRQCFPLLYDMISQLGEKGGA